MYMGERFSMAVSSASQAVTSTTCLVFIAACRAAWCALSASTYPSPSKSSGLTRYERAAGAGRGEG